MIEARIARVLKTLQEKIPAGIKWAVCGSCNLALRGLDVNVHDIDLATDKEGAYAIVDLFPPASVTRVELSTAGKERSYHGGMNIGSVAVDIIGDSQFLQADDTWSPVRDLDTCYEMIDFMEQPLPVLKLTEEYEGYRNIGRLERAAQILKYLKQTRA